jgi:hypothetical protein
VSLFHWNRPRIRRSATLIACTIACTSGLVAFGATSSLAGPGEGALSTDTNALRAKHGLHSYRVCPDLTAIARSWAAHMAQSGGLAHNGGLATQMTNWQSLGENVGAGPTEPVVQQALVDSAPHLANLLSTSFTEVGYGSAVGAGGALYVDEVFRLPMSGACAGVAVTAPAAPAATKASPPAASTTAVTRASRSTSALRSAPQSAAVETTPPQRNGAH